MKKLLVFALVLVMTLSSSCSFGGGDTVDTVNNPPAHDREVVSNTGDKENIILYYADKDATGLFAEVREVSSEESEDALFVAQLLFDGPKSDKHVKVIPGDTTINSCTVEEGVCTLDLSGEFISNHGTANEQLSIYSIVNTLCLLECVEEVEFLIDGEKVMIFGSYIFDEPFAADNEIIKG